MLVMQANSNGSSKPSYGYGAGGLGKISPDYIMYQGEKYVINTFYTSTLFGASYLYFKDDKMPNGERLTVEVNGTVYTLIKNTNVNQYYIKASLFPSVGTYIIKILSIE